MGTWEPSAETIKDPDESFVSGVEGKEVTGGASGENEKKENRVYTLL